MALRKSAGLLVYRRKDGSAEFFLVHPGGPFWRGKDEGAWSIPKGEFKDEEDPLAAARREFMEETGHAVNGEFIPLAPVKQKAGKVVYAWAVEADVDAENLVGLEGIEPTLSALPKKSSAHHQSISPGAGRGRRWR